ncbi:TusE/DsrC/DsvC family sulfur relay protein [Cysteiniphilum halobium]|uniref:TusE/DsrC/DsvC family sulfur relay protein n=1 Tax=Cysteiniphilum halobium TaxID=2219059 RepID=UPI000E65A7EF|nr:TusE/DsrC/DsvC family sulfur relay protein [Cysteiniphilum halobium]
MTQFIELLDDHGFLKDHTQWSPDIAYTFAKEENITLTDAHWQVIYFLREYYKTHSTAPAIRLLVKSLKAQYGNNIGNSLYLQTLFPTSPAVQAAKIAGLPKPKRCI